MFFVVELRARMGQTDRQTDRRRTGKTPNTAYKTAT